MELLKDKLFNGISFEIINEKIQENSYVEALILTMRVTNYNDKKKKLAHGLKYISVGYGLKDSSVLTLNFGVCGAFLQANAFVDLEIYIEGIKKVEDGDRIELEVNKGKFASLRLIREQGQWWIVESIERSTYNKNLKSKIEHFEAIEEQFGIILQNFSVKVRDENSLDLFFEVLALDGNVKNNIFTIEVAIYDSDNDIIHHASIKSYDFKGFEVYHFGTIELDITVDEISKIRIYPVQ